MFIAFEGPDNVGKSTSAANLAWDGIALYNATKDMHQRQREEMELYPNSGPVTYDRIDWFSHMVYRLALPDREWNDDRVRTVFAMPDTHLVVKLHRPDLADFTAEEVVDTPIAQVNPVYYHFATWIMGLNRFKDYSLFKSVSLVEVCNSPDSTYSQQLRDFDSAAVGFDPILHSNIRSDEKLLDFLRYVEHTSL
jgi:hypothetical protein